MALLVTPYLVSCAIFAAIRASSQVPGSPRQEAMVITRKPEVPPMMIRRSELKRRIFEAVKANSQEDVRHLLAEHPDLLNSCDHRRDTLLHVAAQHGDSSLLAFLVDAGLSVNANRSGGTYGAFTSLHAAALAGRTDNVRWLIARGATLDPGAGASATPLACAAMKGHTETVALLISAGADIAYYYRGEGTERMRIDALTLAHLEGHSEVERLLLSRSGEC